jgi:glycine cleavage system T protein
MAEAVEQVTTRRSPLDEVHLRLGACMKEYDGWSVPACYGDVLFEYAAVREGGSGLIDLSARGRIKVTGSEAIQFLNGLITNDVKALQEDRWMLAVFPSVQGRLIASVRVTRHSDSFLIDTEAATHNRVLETLNRFTLAGDFRITDLTEETALVSVQGKTAATIIRLVLGGAAATIERKAATTLAWQDTLIMLMRATHTSEDGFDLVVEANGAPALWDALTSAGARPAGFDALEILRIEAGEPRYGIDMDETTVVTETNLDDAVSYTKGCYLGQEIIARIHFRGHVAKKLTGIVFEQTVKLVKGAKVKSAEDKEIGRITSHTLSPHLGCTVALGYVKYEYLSPGTTVNAEMDGREYEAHVAELPFVRGSWFESSGSKGSNL